MSFGQTGDQSLVQVRDVGHEFTLRGGSSSVDVMRHVSFDIAEGEFVSLVGPSGCGKTTLLRIVAGLVEPVAGHVTIRGETVTAPRQEVAFVFQDDALLPWRSASRNIALGLEAGHWHLSKDEIAARVIDMLRIVGLERFGKSLPHELSGGMRQRVNLGRALVLQPSLLLLDEPFAALDAQTRELMQEELLRIWRTSEAASLFVTHQIDEAVYLADRVVVMGPPPSTVVAQIEVNFERPRTLHLKRTPEFQKIVDEIWDLLHVDTPGG